MLIGRDPERESISGLITAARAGRGGALVLRGEPGIGKTELLAQARRDADGLRILAATGVEAETHLAFAALSDILRPVLDRRDRVAPAQRAALEAALALGPPAVTDRFAAYAGAFALLEASAGDGPVLLAVDDAQWLDAASSEAIGFIARRLEDLPVALLVSVRTGEGSEVAIAGARDVCLEPLSAEDARALLEAGTGEAMSTEVARRILDLAHGNPLALIELPRALSDDERLGRSPLPDPLRVGEVIRTAFRRRLDALDDETRRGLIVVAAGGDDAVEPVLAACERVGSSLAALERAEGAGVLSIGTGRVVFAHPLIRALVLELAPAPEMRAAHRALAEAIAADRGQERRAWHLAWAAVGMDEEAAAALEQAGGAAAARTAYSSATDAMVRSAALSTADDDRARRLLQAAQLAHVAGRMPASVALLGQAAECVRDPGLEAEIDHLRGMVLIYTGPMEDGVRVLFDNADRVAAHSPERAALMLVDSSMSWGMAGHPAMCIVSCERALRLGPLPDAIRAKLDVAMANSLLFVGRGEEAMALAATLEPIVAGFDPVGGDYQAVICGIVVHTYLGEFAVAEREVERAVGACRAAGALGPLAFYLAMGADLAYRRSNWAAGAAAAQEAAQIAEETGQVPIAAYAYAVLARLEATCGADAFCRRHLETSATLAALAGSTALDAWNGHALGLLELARGNLDTVIDTLEGVATMWRREEVRCAEAVRWRQDIIEAYARSGRVTDARRHLRELAEEATLTGTAATHALVARGRGLIAGGDHERHFEEALALHARLPIPIDVARTHLVYGERLRRDRRRAKAREHLTAALEGFEALGARPWTERARNELAAAGVRTASPQSPVTERLTPRELQVALAVARGATNREAASALFLSEKTVERHLSATYAKLGVRSRSELTRLLAREDGPPLDG